MSDSLTLQEVIKFYPYMVDLRLLKIARDAEKWCEKNCPGKYYTWLGYYIFFRRKEDAALCKLFFSKE